MKWDDLSETSRVILEDIYLRGRSKEIEVGKSVSYPYHIGYVTEGILDEIIEHEYSDENRGYFRTEREDEVLNIIFLRSKMEDLKRE